MQRWGAPRAAERAEPAPPAPTQSAPPPAATPSGGSQLQRWGIPRQERQEAAPPRNEPQPRPAFGLRRGAVPRDQTDQPATAAPPVQSLPQTVQTLPQTVQPLPQTVITGGGNAVNRSAAPDGGQRVAQPRQRYPRPEDQQQASGVAVPRGSANPPQRPGSDGRTVIYGNRAGTRVYYNNYYYYPRHNYPYGFGTYGLGYFYYDPYAWYDNSYYADPYSTYSYSYPSYGGGVYQYHSGYPTGELRLQVRPRHAEVYIDGYFAGHVDDFDGYFQGLRIEEGPHTIEIVVPGNLTTITTTKSLRPATKRSSSMCESSPDGRSITGAT